MTIASIRKISRLVAEPPQGQSIPQAHRTPGDCQRSDPLPTCSQPSVGSKGLSQRAGSVDWPEHSSDPAVLS